MSCRLLRGFPGNSFVTVSFCDEFLQKSFDARYPWLCFLCIADRALILWAVHQLLLTNCELMAYLKLLGVEFYPLAFFFP